MLRNNQDARITSDFSSSILEISAISAGSVQSCSVRWISSLILEISVNTRLYICSFELRRRFWKFLQFLLAGFKFAHFVKQITANCSVDTADYLFWISKDLVKHMQTCASLKTQYNIFLYQQTLKNWYHGLCIATPNRNLEKRKILLKYRSVRNWAKLFIFSLSLILHLVLYKPSSSVDGRLPIINIAFITEYNKNRWSIKSTCFTGRGHTDHILL